MKNPKEHPTFTSYMDPELKKKISMFGINEKIKFYQALEIVVKLGLDAIERQKKDKK